MTHDRLQRDLGAAIRKLRMGRGLSQLALAERAGLHRSYITGLEAGRRNPSIRTFQAVAHALRVSPGQFFSNGSTNGLPYLDGDEIGLGFAVRHLRHERGLSQEGLSSAAKLCRSYLAEIETGERNPSLRSVARIAKALGVPIVALFVSTAQTLGAARRR